MRDHGSSVVLDHDACGVGFVAQLGGGPSHAIVEQAIEALLRLSHRGGVDADGRSGDGAGLLTAIPDAFFRHHAHELGIELPASFGLGMVFLPRGQETAARELISVLAAQEGLQCLGWRTVPIEHSIVGPRAAETLPVIEQCFFAVENETTSEELELLLFRLRKRVESQAPRGTYFCSLSSRTVVYKGLLTPDQLPVFYPDLLSPQFESAFALFHQRYSTNTQPSWSLAQPFRFVAHNGEINTIGANRRWMRAKAPALLGELGLPEQVALLEPRVSDSASFDNALEVLLRRGYSSAAAMMSMVAPAWENNRHVPPELRGFLQAQARIQEPWDGPAAMVFTDGLMVGAKLDRNGLRPLRYTLTSDGLLVVGSEVGIVDLHGKHVAERQRLGPGEMLLADPSTGAFFRPSEIPQLREWSQPRASVATVRVGPTTRIGVPTPEPKRMMAALGWSEDRFRLLFQPLVQGEEAVWSMGDDAPPAFLSELRRPLWDYCKQRFAQVTNPAIDPLRESHVMSLDVYLGGTMLSSPLLDAGQLETLAESCEPVACIDITFQSDGGAESAEAALARVRKLAKTAAALHPGLILLTDRAVSASRAALPALLAVSAAWKAMVDAQAWDVPLVIATGQVIDTHHVALLVAAGASAVFPYLALEQAEGLRPDGAANYRVAVEKGLRKVLARMGTSTIASYRNSQLFETLGLDRDVCCEFFEDATYTLGGKSLTELLQDCLTTHAAAFSSDAAELRDTGLYRFRHNGERHATSPELVRRMHRYIKSPSDENFRAFSELGDSREAVAIRDLLEVIPGDAVPLSSVEREASLLSRFSTQAMSLGAISPEAHRTLAIAMNRLGARSNTGEGGEDPDIYRDQPEAGNRVKQVASGRFGVTTEYLVHADELEIKIAQGSKPGEGGQLPSSKVTPYIARLRHAVPNMALISPPPHHDVYSIEDLAQLIYDLRAVNPRARIGVKLVSGAGVGIIAAGVAKAGADVITICGHDGGTGASPLSSIKNTGLPWEVGLRDAHCTLVRAGLRGRVRLRVDGGFKFARDVIYGALLGADEFGFGTAALLAIGCVMARQCHLNTCPVGIATQDEKLRMRFAGSPEMVESYFRGLAREVRELLAGMGAHSIEQIVGEVERLRARTPEAARVVNELLEPIARPPIQSPIPHYDSPGLRVALNRTLNRSSNRTQNRLLDAAVAETDAPVRRSPYFRIANSDRAIGAHLSGEILRRALTLPVAHTMLDYEFVGAAGQSFGAFLVSGASFRLKGEANDYVGKGLCGGTLAITAGDEASERGDVLVGNTVLYGATAGELYVAGRGGERFAVRNSGALAVVEGVGQHGCEYMTAGVVVVLGPAGINLGAGMTGGLAYLMQDSVAGDGYNQQSIRLVRLEVKEELWLRRVLRKHLRLTGSPRALALLNAEGPLPMLRAEPLRPPCSTAETWAPLLSRLKRSVVPLVASGVLATGNWSAPSAR
jgi:glutamate synthase (ferredoxin)